jgi:pimeloyl-ACP methyl ester carboxylesterase
VIVPDLHGHGRRRDFRRRVRLPSSHLTYRGCSTIWASARPPRLATRSAVQSRGNWSLTTQVMRPPRARLPCAFNMSTARERLQGHLLPLLVHVLGMRRLAKFVVSQGAKQLGKERAHWLAGLIAVQDRKLMVSAWRETMAFDSRRRLAEIACPTHVAASDDRAVPIQHAKILHDGIAGSQLVIIDGADHAPIWTHSDDFLRVTDEYLGA